jgi:hypothetical protein
MRTAILLAVFSLPAFGQGAFYQFPVPLPGATFRVCPVGTQNPCPTPVNIYSDQALTHLITQPASTGPTGAYAFWVSPGQYTIQIGQPYDLVYILNLGGSGGGVIVGPPNIGVQVVGNGSSFVAQAKPVIDVRDFGAVGDGQVATDCYMTSGSPVLNCETAHFFMTDIGKKIAVYGSGPTNNGLIQPLSSSIIAFTSGTQVTLNDNANTSTTHVIATISSCSRSLNVATCTTTGAHNFQAGQMVNINNVGASGFTQDSSFIGVWPIQTVPAGNQFTLKSYLLNDVTSVTGGVADGHSERTVWGTDNTAALQAAVDAAGTAGGGKVLIPKGLYLTHGINMACAQIGNFTGAGYYNCTVAYNYVTIQGDGADVTGLENWDVNVTMAQPWDNSPGAGHPGIFMLGISSLGDYDVPPVGGPTIPLNHIEISGLTIRQAKNIPSGAKAIFDEISNDVNIHDNKVMGFSYECIYQGGKSRRWDVHDNYVTQCGEGGPSNATSTSALNENGWDSVFHDNRVDDSGQCMEGAGHDDMFIGNSCDMRGTDSASASPLYLINLSSATYGLWRWVIRDNRGIGGSGTVENVNGMMRDVAIEGNTFIDPGSFSIGSGKETNNVNYGPQPPRPHGTSSFSNNTLLYTGLQYPVTFPFSINGNQHPLLEDVLVDSNRIIFKTGYCSSAPHASCLSTGDCSAGTCTVPVGAFSIPSPGLGPTWVTLTVYGTGSVAAPSVENGYIYMNLGASGTSGGSEPVWCTTTNPPCTVVDGTVTWTLYNHRPRVSFTNTTMVAPAGLAPSGVEVTIQNTPTAGYTIDKFDYNLASRFTTPGATVFPANSSILNRNQEFFPDNMLDIGAAALGRPRNVYIASSLFQGSVTFATLPSAPSNGQRIYCSDCTVATPASCTNVTTAASCTCTSGGTGAEAKRINGAWLCN